MKKIYMLNNSNGVIGLILGLKSRIHTYLPRVYHVIAPMLFVAFGLFGVNEKAFSAWSGSGQGVEKNGTWYVLYEDGEATMGYWGTKTYTLSGPGASLTFDAKRQTAGTGNLKVSDNDGNSIFNNSLSTGYASKSGTVKNSATSLEFYNDGTRSKYVKNVHVTMAQYLNNPTKTDLDCGTADINSPNPTSGQVNVAWCNVPAMSYEIIDDAEGLFSVSVDVNSEAGKYNTSHFTVTYKHTKAGTHTAKLKITDSYNSYSKTVNLTGTTNKLQPTVTWSSNDAIFNVDDELSASNSNDLTVTLSGNSTYVTCTGNTAVMKAATSGTITITAHVAGNDIYADKDFTKDITITNLEKQHITWTQDFSRLKTTDGTKSITLNATASSGLAVSYELSGDKTGLSLTQSGNTWTLTYSATECKNTTIVAKQAGNGTYAPASSVSLPVKVIDPTKVCDASTVLVNSQVSIKSSSVTYNIDIPASMTVSFSRMKQGLLDVYLRGLSVEFYSDRNGSGTKLYTKDYSASDIDKTLSNSNIDLSSYIHAKSVKITTEATNGYYIDAVSYTHQKYCTISPSSLAFETFPNTATSAKSFNVNYANYPIFVECSNAKFTVSPTEFGDCGDYGTQAISVSYTAGADEGEDSGVIYIKDNTGVTLKTCSLSVVISKLTQSITSTTIQSSYNTTDRIELSAEANSGLTEFEYSASPAGVASFDGNVMTFSQSGTIAITATQPGSNVYAAASTTVNGVQVNKVTPNIATNPTGTAILYRGTLNGSTLSGGSADVTLRGVAHSAVAGSFAWADPTHVVMDAEGTHNYSVTFTPTDGGMYTTKEFTIPISITRATQAIVMKDSTVKVAVNGIDEGKADSYLDLDDLIVSQTSDIVNNNQRAGAVSYVVLSDNSDKATIATGNIFSATEIGEYTIRAIKAQTNYYNLVADTFVVTVGKRANTMVLDNTAYEKFVDDTVHNVRSVQNSDGTIHTSSTNETLAYYDINQNKIFFPNSDEQEFGKYTTVTIKIWQDETVRFEALDTQEITLTVKKYETVLSGQDYIIKVDNTQTGEFAFTYTSTAKPSNDPNDDFYYTINEPNFDNEALNNGTELITFDPSNNQISAHNAGRTKLSFFQKETRLYTGATAIYNIAVEKHANKFTSSWNVWQKAMDDNQTVNAAFTTTHGDYGNYPISIEQTYGEDVATLTGTADAASITTNTTHGYAIWHLSQAENYKYYSAEADVLVMVGVPAPPTCYVYEDLGTEHKFSTSITDAEGHFDNPIVINSPIDKIWYSAKRQFGGVNYFVVQYSTDGGSTWKTVSSPDLSTSYQDLEATFPAMTGTKKITHVRFGATTGATLSKWYKDVRISRKAYLNIQNAQKETITSLPTLVCTLDENTQAQAKFYIDYSTCADSIIIESNESHFTVSRSLIYLTSGDNLNSTKEEITVTYNSSEEGSHNGVITVRTDYQIRAISVSGETTKREQTLTWQEGYTNNPLTLPIGLKVDANHPAATSSSGADVKYASSNEDVVKILDNGYSFMVIGAGSATLTATAPANGVWNSISDTRVINTTHKTVQEIVWNQTFPRFMNPGDVIDLDAKVYIRNLTTGEKEYSEARTQALTYSCPLNNGILSVSGNKMTILAYGEMDVMASVGGNAEYAAAADVTVTVNAHQQSAGCPTPLVVNHEDIIQMFEVNIDFSSYTNLTTEQMISDEIAIDHSNGKPDKLSFSYEGEEYAFGLLNFFGGYIKFEQHVNSNWIAVENSRVEPKKNEWKTLSNLQLDENADALRIIREAGGTGYHNIKDLQVTRKQYLVPTQVEVDLDTVRVGQAVPSTVGFDYSDIKGDLTARTTFTNDVTLANNGAIDLECGSFGHYNLGFTYLASAVGDWKDTIEIYDNIADLTIRIALKATVTANEEYIFVNAGNWNEGDNWSTQIVPNGVNVTVASDLTVNSAANVNSITINEGVTVTVKSGVTLVIGNGNPKDQTTYGNLYVEDGGQVILHNGELRVNDFMLEASIGSMSRSASSGQVNGEETKLQVGGESYFQICFDPVAISYGWYDFVLPFDVDVVGGIYLPSDLNTPLVNNVDFAIMEFSEADRAANKKAWHWFSGTLKAGKLYTITLDETQPSRTTYVFKKKASAELGAANTYNAKCTTSAPATDRGWNGLGNGTLRYCQLNTESLPDDAKMQIYDHNNDCYKPCEATEYTYAIGTAFFIQVNENNQTITLDTVADSRAFRAPGRDMRSVEEFRLALKAEDTEYTLDNLWISASEEATEEYEIGKDLLKMGTPTSAKTAQMWATKGGLKLCDIETRMEGNGASSDLNLYVPQAGMYELEVEKMPEDATLYLTYNGRAIWVLSASPYMLDLNAGVTEGYGLRIEAQAPQVATGFENGGLLNDANNVRKVVIDNTIYIITPEGKMYDIVGKSVKY